MNCPNCGAAMRLVDRRDYWVCDYCTTFHFPDRADVTAAGLTLLDGRSERSCPVCRVPLVLASAEGRTVAYCETCRGLLADREGFVDIVRARRAKRAGPPQAQQPINPVELKRQLHCPACDGVMDVHPYYGPGNAVIDTCGRCGLIWLDHGELGIIENAPGRV
jgi:Zn-finger nucleic acid-binding protein